MRIKATIAYDGKPFHGFAPNQEVRTVGGELAEALSRNLRQPIALTCAGRTDTGVHAWGQVVSFDGPEHANFTGIRTSINRMLAPSVVIRDISEAPPDFDARFSATGRTYRYTVLNREVPDPFLVATTWHQPHPLDLAEMNAAAAALVGTHDFSSFCRRQYNLKNQEKTRVRVVRHAAWTDAGDDKLCFQIEASSFCHQMVRSITGTLVEIGAGRRKSSDMAEILAQRDRTAAPILAPPHGLCLWSVSY